MHAGSLEDNMVHPEAPLAGRGPTTWEELGDWSNRGPLGEMSNR